MVGPGRHKACIYKQEEKRKRVFSRMKRFNWLLTLFLVLSVGLAACGDAPTNTSVATTRATTTQAAATTAASATTQAASAATTSASAAAGFPLTITDGSGVAITLPKRAERIICLAWECMDALVELEIAPIGLAQAYAEVGNDYLFKPELLGEKFKTAAKIGGPSTAEPNLEDLVAAKPDLVIGYEGMAKNAREALKNVAPVYVLKTTSKVYTGVFDSLLDIGKLTGKSEKAEAAVKRFQTRLDAYKAKSPKDQKVLLLIYYNSPPVVVTDSSIAGTLLKEATPYPWPALGTDNAAYSLEKILEIDPDVIFVGTRNPAYTPAKNVEADLKVKQSLQTDPFWSQVKAVKNGKVFEVERWKITGATLALSSLLDDVMTKTYPQVFPKPL
jgi:iron complex transport system substrate-binding protein